MLLIGVALAGVEPADRLLATASVAIGLAPDGSAGNRTAGVGLLSDPDGPGGTPPGGDWVMGSSGYTLEGWALQWDGGAVSAFTAYGASGPTLTWSARTSGGIEHIAAVGEGESFDVDLSVAAPWDAPVIWLDLTVIAHEDLGGLAFARILDPDPDLWLTGSYDADVRLAGGVVLASSPTDGRTLALAAAGGQAGDCSWCTTVDGLSLGDAEWSGDGQVGVRIDAGELAAGDSYSFRVAYAFGADPEEALAAVEAAVDAADRDGDGVDDAADCAPWDGAVAAGLAELADGLDNDCDGVVDEDLPASAGPTDTGWGPELAEPEAGSYEMIGDCAVAPGGPSLTALLVAASALIRRRRALCS